MKKQIVYRHVVTSPIGKLTLLSTEQGLCFLALPGTDESEEKKFLKKHFPYAEIKAGGRINEQAEQELQLYFDGKLREFRVPVDLRVTQFRKDSLAHVRRIGFGQTKTYGEIAKELGKPTAARAVGAANGANPVPIVIPCHRVVAGHGLGGYGGGLDLKKRLLALEGAKI